MTCVEGFATTQVIHGRCTGLVRSYDQDTADVGVVFHHDESSAERGACLLRSCLFLLQGEAGQILHDRLRYEGMALARGVPRIIGVYRRVSPPKAGVQIQKR